MTKNEIIKTIKETTNKAYHDYIIAKNNDESLGKISKLRNEWGALDDLCDKLKIEYFEPMED